MNSCYQVSVAFPIKSPTPRDYPKAMHISAGDNAQLNTSLQLLKGGAHAGRQARARGVRATPSWRLQSKRDFCLARYPLDTVLQFVWNV